jgi:CRISPR type III-A-associated protein Csm2
MPDMRNAMERVGFKGTQPGGQGRTDNPFPAGYPQYFTPDGHTRVALVTAEAEKVAAQFESDKLKRHQLRSFYDHAKRQLQRLKYGATFAEIHPEIARLKAFAADRAARSDNAVPPSFKRFIDLNVDAVKDEASFKKGFMPHFEAVVAYCARIG